jgi:hypothetical protein
MSEILTCSTLGSRIALKTSRQTLETDKYSKNAKEKDKTCLPRMKRNELFRQIWILHVALTFFFLESFLKLLLQRGQLSLRTELDEKQTQVKTIQEKQLQGYMEPTRNNSTVRIASTETYNVVMLYT